MNKMIRSGVSRRNWYWYFHIHVWPSGARIYVLLCADVRNLASTNNSRGIDICVKNNITRKVLSEITYPFPNIDCITFEVWKWIGNFIPHIIMDAITYPMLFVRRFCFDVFVFIIVMTSSNGDIFRVTDHLWGEFTCHWRISHTKAIDAEVWCFLWSRKHQSSASLAFVRWIHGRPV